MENSLKKYIESKGHNYIPIENKNFLEKISGLFVNGVHFEPIESEELHYYGFYYGKIEKDYVQMKKYYLMAIELNNNSAMYNLGHYYETIEKDYVQLKKYYLMAIELGHSNAINNLGNYYDRKNMLFEKMELCMTYPTMIKRKILIKSINDVCISNSINDNEQFIKLIMSFKFEETDELCLALKILLNCLKNQMTIFELHFDYSINGKGYDDAKKDFISRCSNQNINTDYFLINEENSNEQYHIDKKRKYNSV